MAQQSDFFQKKLSNTRSFRRQSGGSSGWIRGIVALLLLALGGFGVYRLFFASPNLEVNQEISQTSLFSLGQEVVLQGELKADGDIVRYTHTIADAQYAEPLAVKSKTVSLNDYAGIVEVTGIVEKFYQGFPIIEILAISGQKLGMYVDEMDTNVVLDKFSGMYLLSAGILFLPEFFDRYLLLNEGENGQILMQDIDTDREMTLNYFRCNATDPNRNCKGLVETFSQTAARSFVTANGDTYYKWGEINSRFVANGDWRGMFINDVADDDTVFALKDLIVFANANVMRNWVDIVPFRVCQDAGERLQRVGESSITLKQEGLIATIKGEGLSRGLECVVVVDFNLPMKGSLVSLTSFTGEIEQAVVQAPVEEVVPTTDKKADPATTDTSIVLSPATRNPNVPQFALQPEKGLTYNSSRGGYSLRFPSPSISYAASAVQENFGSAGLLCSYVINVIQYAHKDNLEISPSLRIYEC